MNRAAPPARMVWRAASWTASHSVSAARASPNPIEPHAGFSNEATTAKVSSQDSWSARVPASGPMEMRASSTRSPAMLSTRKATSQGSNKAISTPPSHRIAAPVPSAAPSSWTSTAWSRCRRQSGR